MKDYNEALKPPCTEMEGSSTKMLHPSRYVLVATVAETDRCTYGIVVSGPDRRMPQLFDEEYSAIKTADALILSVGIIGRMRGGTLQVVLLKRVVTLSCWLASDWLLYAEAEP